MNFLEHEGKNSGTKNYSKDRFQYYRTRSNEKSIYLRCFAYLNRSGPKCTATAKIDIQQNFLVELQPHNHDALTDQMEVEKFKRRVKKRVLENPHQSARVIFNDESRQHPEAARQVSYKQIESTLQKIKLKVRPKNPQSLHEYVDELQSHPELSKYFRGSVNNLDGEINAVLFSTDPLTDSLLTATSVAFDGTFFVCPRPFVQVFTIFSAHENHFFPAVVVLMIKRDKKSYLNVFQKIKELSPNFMPEFCISDFEKASRQAFKEIWPDSVLSGCYFHFSQSVLRKLKKLGLLPLFRRNNEFQKYARCFMAFSLLPENDFDQVFSALDAQVLEGISNLEKSLIQKFKIYFKKTWLSPSVRNQLSVFGKPFTTNNGSETFHAQFKKHFLSSQPNIWAFSSELGRILDAYGVDLDRLQSGLQITRNRKKRVARNLARRERAQEKLRSNKISSLRYLKIVSHTLDSLIQRQTENQVPESDSENEMEVAEAAENNLPSTTPQTPECMICTDSYHERWVFTPCGHSELCPDCNSLFTGEQRLCPICRVQIQGRLRIFI